MKSSRRRLELARLDGHTMAVGCLSCPILDECGGYLRNGAGWSCFDECSSCDQTCDRVCLKRPHFARAFAEIGGFGADRLVPLRAASAPLPPYVPVIQYGIGKELPLSVAALPLHRVMRGRGRKYGVEDENESALRSRFNVAAGTRLVLLGPGKDPGIEKYWSFRAARGLAPRLARIGFECGIAPNYSFFLNHPRSQHLHNRKRSLLCASEWSDAGIASVPHLSAVTSRDWTYWRDFLREQDQIRIVSKEFQTGNRRIARGVKTIDALARLQDELRRPLHLVAIGGARYRSRLTTIFDTWTLMDSTPFMKAVKRHRAVRAGRRLFWERAPDADVPALFMENLERYTAWLGVAVPVLARGSRAA